MNESPNKAVAPERRDRAALDLLCFLDADAPDEPQR